MRNSNELEAFKEIKKNMKINEDYYLGIGQHAAIIKKNEFGTYYYIELQEPKLEKNGYQLLWDMPLEERFNCEKRGNRDTILIRAETLYNNKEFIKILGFLNTEEYEQRKGVDGSIK